LAFFGFGCYLSRAVILIYFHLNLILFGIRHSIVASVRHQVVEVADREVCGESVGMTAAGKVEQDDDVSDPAAAADDDDVDDEEQKAADLEARAIAEAMQSADASYVPSPSLLAADDAAPLLSQVDGVDLTIFNSKPNVYQAKAVPVHLRGRLDIPIHVTAGGSVVEYEITTDLYDIGFGVTAEREEGITYVKESSRVDSHLEPVTGKFLVGSVPCALVFSFDNEYSWFREKRVTYKIIVTPPNVDNVIMGRRLRAKKALEIVAKDRDEMNERYETAAQKHSELEEAILQLEKELAEKRKSLDVILKEESWLERKLTVRGDQIKMLNQRLKKGWDDEKSEI
jgi:hypothetical protein